MKHYLILPIFLLFTFSSLAQKSDYLLTNTGDSLYGSIQLNKNYFTVTTPENESHSIHAGKVKQINSLHYKGTIFYGSLLPYDDDLYYNNLSSATDRFDTVLVLKTIYKSPKIDLLQGYDKLKRIYYFVQKPTDIAATQMLVNYQIQIIENPGGPVLVQTIKGGIKLQQIKIYTVQLKNMMADCVSIKEQEWEAMDYRSYSFIRIIKLYNWCN
ncbi:MAG: hypothetical protein ACOYLO_02415 [Ferruginibacter sp.]